MFIQNTKGCKKAGEIYKKILLYETRINDYASKNRWIRMASACFIALIFLPAYYVEISLGLDPSWVYAINCASRWGLKFGTDINYTYGPLGFVICAQNVESNICFSFVFHIVLSILHIFLIYSSLQKFSIRNFLLAVVLSMAAIPIVLGDYYLLHLLMISLSLAWFSERKTLYFYIALFLLVLLMFIKFSGAFAALISVFLFVVFYCIYNKKVELRFIFGIVATPVIFAISYMLYNPSFFGLISYVKSALEISSGYNSAMSVSWMTEKFLLKAIIIGGCYILFAIVTSIKNLQTGLYLFMFGGVLFASFKHGFVRADGHVSLFFMGVMCYLSIVALFYRETLHSESKIRVKVCIVSLFCIMILFCIASRPIQNPVQIIVKNGIISTINWVKYAREGEGEGIHGENKLPQKILNEVKEETITIYPWEIAYAAYNDINVRPMPALQAFSVYTPYLDQKNAEFFLQDETAPRYILFSLETIDYRWPLVECPITWRTIYENYNVRIYDAKYLLLKRAIQPKVGNIMNEVYQEHIQKDSVISLPLSQSVVLLKLDTELTFWGKFCKTFYKIEDVYMRVKYNDGNERTMRVLPEMMCNPVIISNIPMDHNEATIFLNNESRSLLDKKRIQSIQFYGPGWTMYRDDLSLTIMDYEEINSIPLGFAQEIYGDAMKFSDVLSSKNKVDDSWEGHLDSVNGEAALQRAICTKNEILYLDGWCVNITKKNVADELYLRIEDTLYLADTIERPDVSAYFSENAYVNSGYLFHVPMGKLHPGVYNCSLILLYGDEYLEADIGFVLERVDTDEAK